MCHVFNGYCVVLFVVIFCYYHYWRYSDGLSFVVVKDKKVQREGEREITHYACVLCLYLMWSRCLCRFFWIISKFMPFWSSAFKRCHTTKNNHVFFYFISIHKSLLKLKKIEILKFKRNLLLFLALESIYSIFMFELYLKIYEWFDLIRW